MTDAMMDEMFALLRDAMQNMYADRLPAGYVIHRLAAYDTVRHPAPNLLFEKHQHPAAKYLAILVNDTSSVPALGETVTEAIERAIAKIELRGQPLS